MGRAAKGAGWGGLGRRRPARYGPGAVVGRRAPKGRSTGRRQRFRMGAGKVGVQTGGAGRPVVQARLVAFQVVEDVPLLVEVGVAEVLQLGDGLLVAPALELHAVNGAVGAGAVDAGEAVDEDGVVA